MMTTFTTALLTLLAVCSIMIPAGLVLLTFWDAVCAVLAHVHDRIPTRHK